MKQIEIRTAQNVTIDYELATLWERALSFLIDFIIYFIFYISAFSVVNAIFSWEILSSGGFIDLIIVMLFMFGLLGYHFFMELGFNGQSVGKMALGIRVVRVDGEEAGISAFLLRSLFLVVDFFLSLGILAMLFIVSSTRHQRLGDLTANTTIIRLRTSMRFKLGDILKINTVENYEPQYEEVKRLKEEDMLLIKEVLNRQMRYQNAAHDEALEQMVDKVVETLDIERPKKRHYTAFLRTLIRDYIVLTR